MNIEQIRNTIKNIKDGKLRNQTVFQLIKYGFWEDERFAFTLGTFDGLQEATAAMDRDVTDVEKANEYCNPKNGSELEADGFITDYGCKSGPKGDRKWIFTYGDEEFIVWEIIETVLGTASEHKLDFDCPEPDGVRRYNKDYSKCVGAREPIKSEN